MTSPGSAVAFLYVEIVGEASTRFAPRLAEAAALALEDAAGLQIHEVLIESDGRRLILLTRWRTDRAHTAWAASPAARNLRDWLADAGARSAHALYTTVGTIN